MLVLNLKIKNKPSQYLSNWMSLSAENIFIKGSTIKIFPTVHQRK